MTPEGAEQGHYVAAHQRFAAGQAQLSDPEANKRAAHTVELFERQQLGFREKRHLFRHAIDTAEIAAVGDRYAQISDRSSKRVDHAWLVRTAAYLRNIGTPPVNVAPDLVVLFPITSAAPPAASRLEPVPP